MTFRVIVAERAERELEATALWWAEHHSKIQAERWYEGFRSALASLQSSPERCAFARESERLAIEVRQLNYGIGSRPTHRAVFTIRGDAVVVLTIRHLAQQDLVQNELP